MRGLASVRFHLHLYVHFFMNLHAFMCSVHVYVCTYMQQRSAVIVIIAAAVTAVQ